MNKFHLRQNACIVKKSGKIRHMNAELCLQQIVSSITTNQNGRAVFVQQTMHETKENSAILIKQHRIAQTRNHVCDIWTHMCTKFT